MFFDERYCFLLTHVKQFHKSSAFVISLSIDVAVLLKSKVADLNVEPELDDIAVDHYIVFAFHAHLACRFGICHGAKVG